jgi:hypothetical protein
VVEGGRGGEKREREGEGESARERRTSIRLLLLSSPIAFFHSPSF